MSEANVELVRAVYSAWERGESAEDLIAEDVEYVNPPYAVEPGTRRGRATFGRVGDAYDDIRVRPHRFVDVGDDVVVLATVTARSRGAGVPVHREHGYIWTVRDDPLTLRAPHVDAPAGSVQ